MATLRDFQYRLCLKSLCLHGLFHFCVNKFYFSICHVYAVEQVMHKTVNLKAMRPKVMSVQVSYMETCLVSTGTSFWSEMTLIHSKKWGTILLIMRQNLPGKLQTKAKSLRKQSQMGNVD